MSSPLCHRLPAKITRVSRMLAAVAWFGFVAGMGESMIPDAHDGDAPSALVLDASSGAHQAAESVQDASTAQNHGASHPVHVDHCGHGHAAGAVPPMTIGPSPRARPARPSASVPDLVSVAPLSLSKPPIA